MLKKVLCSLLSIILVIIVGGNFVFANEDSLQKNKNSIALEEIELIEEKQIEKAIHELEELQVNVTRRFIIKFKETLNASLNVEIESAFGVAKEAKEQVISAILATNNIDLKTIYGEEAGKDSGHNRLQTVLDEIDVDNPALMAIEQSSSNLSTEITALQGNKLVISLQDKVDTEVFAQEIQNSLGAEIEYIQPDYELGLAAHEDESISLDMDHNQKSRQRNEENRIAAV